jgi:arylsulfate sulfotransferase
MLGQELKKDSISDNYQIHHDIVELPNGDLLLAVRKKNTYIEIDGNQYLSGNDFIVLYSREKSEILKEWDLAKHLDVSRADLSNGVNGDWLHMNGLAFDLKDSSIIVSCRKQGLVKISWQDELEWILAPKKNWGKSGRNGDGFDTRPYLLTAVNSNAEPYSTEVQNGGVSPEDFDFPWGQHAPELLPNGNIILFDNGYLRNFKFGVNYSRAVEYKINEQTRTAEQIWQYGKERGKDFFSMLISDVDYLYNSKNILITSGYIAHNGKIVEVNYPEGTEVFEATLYFNTLNGNRTFAWGQLDILYRSDRFDLKF